MGNFMKSNNYFYNACCAALAFVGLAGSMSAQAQDRYPSRLIQIVVGYAPGSTDNIVRPFMDKVAEQLKQPVVIMYKAGAGGAIAASSVAKSKPDGYTFLVSSAAAVILNPLSNPNVDYKVDDLVPVARLVSLPLGIAVRTDSPFKSVRDIVEAARARPGTVTYSSAGPTSTPDVMMQLFARVAKVKLSHIPYNGSAPALVALLGGHVQIGAAPLYGFDTHARAGTMRVLGVATETRTKETPDVPTFTESGYPFHYSTWHAVFAPRGTPQAIIDAFHADIKTAVEKDTVEFDKKMKVLGVSLDLAGPAEFGRAVQQEVESMKLILPADGKAPS